MNIFKKLGLVLMIFVLSINIANAIVTDNYIAFYPFTADFTDSSANTNNANNNNCTIVGDYADCTGGFIDTQLDSEFDNVEVLTIHFWVNYTVSTTKNMGADGDDRVEIDFNQLAEGRHRAYTKISNSVAIQGTLDTDPGDNDGDWHLHVIQWDGSNGILSWYIDNSLVVDSQTSSNSGILNTLSNSFFISGFNKSTTDTKFDANWNGFGFYEGSLTSMDRTLLFSQGRTYDPFVSSVSIMTNLSGTYNKNALDGFIMTNTSANLSYYFGSEGTEQAYYQFAANYVDSTGTYNGTNNGVNFLQANYGLAGDFDGASYIDLGTAWGNVEENSFSVCSWINVSKDGQHNTILSKGQTSSNDFIFYKDSSDRLSLFLNKASGSDLTLQIPPADWTENVWNHFCATFNGTAGQAYLNSVLEKTDSTVGTGTSNAHNWVIGASNDGTGRYFNATMDELRYWDRALNSSEIFSVYNKTYLSICNNCGADIYSLYDLHLTHNPINLQAVNSNGTFYNDFFLKYQPLQFFYFFNSTGGQITDFTFNNIIFDQFATFNATDLEPFGNKTLTFSKQGFVETNITFPLSISSQINLSTNITFSSINVFLYDRQTENLITQLLNVDLIGPLGDNDTTTTGLVNFTEINRPSGDYQILASGTGYSTESVYFTFNGEELINQELYLLNSSASNGGTIQIIVKDIFSQFIENAVVSLLEWKSSENAFVSVAQCSTDANGVCSLNIELNDKLYKFQAQKAGVTTTSNSQLIPTTGGSLTLILNEGETPVSSNLEGVGYSFTETIAGNVSTTRFQWSDNAGLISNACISVYRVSTWSSTLLNSNCTAATSGIKFLNTDINNSFTIKISAEIVKEGITYSLKSFTHKSTTDISKTLEDNNIDIFIPLVMGMLAVAAGLFLGNIYIAGFLLILGSWSLVAFLPSLFTGSIATVVTVIMGLGLWGAIRK